MLLLEPRQRRDDGTVTVELVVLFPLLAFLVFLPLIFNLALWSKVIVTDAAREAARHVALNLGTAQEKVEEIIQAGNLDPARVQDVVVREAGNYVEVTVRYNQPTILPGLPALMGGRPWDESVTLQSTSVFKKEFP